MIKNPKKHRVGVDTHTKDRSNKHTEKETQSDIENEEEIEEMTSPYAYANYHPTLWVQAEEEDDFIGICTFGKGIFRIGSMHERLIIRDIIVHPKDGCEEAYRCINRRCSYNKTTFDDWARSIGIIDPLTSKQQEMLVKTWEKAFDFVRAQRTQQFVETVLEDYQQKTLTKD